VRISAKVDYALRAMIELAAAALPGERRSARRVAGYSAQVSIGEISPRGIPVPHHDLRLERKDWTAPFPVEITGLEPALPLFGAA